jgi:hypothetical protein
MSQPKINLRSAGVASARNLFRDKTLWRATMVHWASQQMEYKGENCAAHFDVTFQKGHELVFDVDVGFM